MLTHDSALAGMLSTSATIGIDHLVSSSACQLVFYEASKEKNYWAGETTQRLRVLTDFPVQFLVRFLAPIGQLVIVYNSKI